MEQDKLTLRYSYVESLADLQFSAYAQCNDPSSKRTQKWFSSTESLNEV